jgi:hypothetical protein
LLAVQAVPDLDALSGVRDTYSILEAEIGKNTEGVDGSSYPHSTAMRLPKRHGKAGGALMISDKELPLAGQFPGPFASKHQHHVAAKQSLRRIRRSPPTLYASDWSQKGLHAQAHALE